MQSRWIVTILLLVLAFVLPGDVSAQSTSLEDASIEDATVNLYCRVKTAGRTYSTSGSGVFIHENGTILTNAHVAQYFLLPEEGRTTARCMVRTGSPAKDQYRAKLVYLSPAWAQNVIEATTKNQPSRGTGEFDFALLRVIGAKRGEIPDRFPALVPDLDSGGFDDGMEVIAAGYPSAGVRYRDMQNKLAQAHAETYLTSVQSFALPHHDVLVLAPSPLSAAGVSGGPIVFPSGEVIGIATTVKESAKSGNDRSLRAITLSYIDRILRTTLGFSLANYSALSGMIELDTRAEPYVGLAQTIEQTLRNTR